MSEMRLCGRGSAPDPAGGAYSAPRPPSWILGRLLLREWGEGRERWEGRGRKGKGREGKGRGGKRREEEGGGRFDPHFSSLSAAPAYNNKPRIFIFTARCTLVQSAVLRSHVVCPSVRLSVCDVGEL